MTVFERQTFLSGERRRGGRNSAKGRTLGTKVIDTYGPVQIPREQRRAGLRVRFSLIRRAGDGRIVRPTVRGECGGY